ncbi:hypothetical protein JJB07_06165 [Tumebacillus sp. ITR2]|uniref:Tail fiber protein n=1 Tax=Tumebacillus amylolyticus TaxID=2801339 RepID=A0ABS1J7H6_9BACL|nr:hypothetical protein [Tumebacillus amylolyticus]MBL0386236.1 hypothetical protein [Tumebacillus amylolyticus]
MTLSISFYNNVKYTKDDFMNRDRDFFGNGVVTLTDFPLTLGPTPLTLTIGGGVAWVDGYRIANDDLLPVPLMIDKGDAQKRIDIIQLGHDDVNSRAVMTVKKGVPADTPIEPGADPGYLKLFAISVDANVTSLSSDKVTDRRNLVPLKVSGTQISFTGAVSTTQLGQANGVATLGADGKVPSLQLPTLVAMGALSAGTGNGSVRIDPAYELSSDTRTTTVTYGINGLVSTVKETDPTNSNATIATNSITYGTNGQISKITTTAGGHTATLTVNYGTNGLVSNLTQTYL